MITSVILISAFGNVVESIANIYLHGAGWDVDKYETRKRPKEILHILLLSHCWSPKLLAVPLEEREDFFQKGWHGPTLAFILILRYEIAIYKMGPLIGMAKCYFWVLKQRYEKIFPFKKDISSLWSSSDKYFIDGDSFSRSSSYVRECF